MRRPGALAGLIERRVRMRRTDAGNGFLEIVLFGSSVMTREFFNFWKHQYVNMITERNRSPFYQLKSKSTCSSPWKPGNTRPTTPGFVLAGRDAFLGARRIDFLSNEFDLVKEALQHSMPKVRAGREWALYKLLSKRFIPFCSIHTHESHDIL